MNANATQKEMFIKDEECKIRREFWGKPCREMPSTCLFGYLI